MKRLVICSPYHTSITNPRSIRVRNLINQIESSSSYIFLTNPTSHDSVNNSNIKLHGIRIARQNGNRTIKGFFSNGLKFFAWPDRFLLNSLYHSMLYLIEYRSKDDILLTISNPISCHFVGLFSKLLFSKSTFWIADIGDLFSASDTSFLRFVTSYFEKLVIRKADRIVVNSQGMLSILENRYSELQSKMIIISNGSSIEFGAMKSIQTQYVQVNYIGNSYIPIRPGNEELAILIQARKLLLSHDYTIEINLFGRQHQELIAQYSDSTINFHSFVETNFLKSIYLQTNILFSLANKDYNTMPSKLEEYYNSGLPIIYFCYNSLDCGIDYLSKSTNVFIFVIGTSKIEELAKFIIQHYADGINYRLNPKNDDKSWLKLLEDLNN